MPLFGFGLPDSTMALFGFCWPESADLVSRMYKLRMRSHLIDGRAERAPYLIKACGILKLAGFNGA